MIHKNNIFQAAAHYAFEAKHECVFMQGKAIFFIYFYVSSFVFVEQKVVFNFIRII